MDIRKGEPKISTQVCGQLANEAGTRMGRMERREKRNRKGENNEVSRSGRRDGGEEVRWRRLAWKTVRVKGGKNEGHQL